MKSIDRKEGEVAPCPSFVFLKRGVSGDLQLEIPMQYKDEFEPITTETYNAWLEEKSSDPAALSELGEDETDVQEEL